MKLLLAQGNVLFIYWYILNIIDCVYHSLIYIKLYFVTNCTATTLRSFCAWLLSLKKLAVRMSKPFHKKLRKKNPSTLWKSQSYLIRIGTPNNYIRKHTQLSYKHTRSFQKQDDRFDSMVCTYIKKLHTSNGFGKRNILRWRIWRMLRIAW